MSVSDTVDDQVARLVGQAEQANELPLPARVAVFEQAQQALAGLLAQAGEH